MTLEFEVDVDYLTDGGIKDMPTWVKLNDEDGEHASTVYVNSSSYWHVVDDNVKLRELAAGIGHLLFPLDVDYCAICPRDDINHPCPVHTVDGGECLYETDLRELGVEL